jgi:putative transposase
MDVKDRDIEILRAILDELGRHPFYGYRKIAIGLNDLGVTRKQIRRIMKKAGLRAIFPSRNLSKAAKGHAKYPYLLRNKTIWLPNQVWASDITYIRLSGGYVYLTTIIDLFSRKILSWRVSNTMDAEFCVAALEEAIMRFGIPAIFNTDQGSQYTSDAFIEVLMKHRIEISMDGLRRALDNILVERFWRSLKYEEIYLNEYRTMSDLKESLNRYFQFFNTERFHESLEYLTPDQVYFGCFVETTDREAA